MQSGLQAIAYLDLQTSTSTFKHLSQPQPQSQRPDGLVTCIIPNTPHDSRRAYNRGLYIQSSEVQAYVSTAKPGGHWSTHQKAFIILVTALTFLKTKLMSAQGRSLSCVQLDFHPHHHQEVLKGDTPHASTSG